MTRCVLTVPACFVCQAPTPGRQAGADTGYDQPYGRGPSMLEPEYGDYEDELAGGMGHQRFGKRRRMERGPLHKSPAICSYFMQGKCQKVSPRCPSVFFLFISGCI